MVDQDSLYAVASRVTRALELTLSQPTFLETLVKEYGVCVEEVRIVLSCQVPASKSCIRAIFTLQVRMSPDMLTAYVLWSAHPDCEDAAQHELQSRYEQACHTCRWTVY